MPSEWISGSQKEMLPLHFDGLTEEMKQRLRDELLEKEEIVESSLATLRRLLDEDEKLFYPDDDSFLIEFLRARKYNIKKAVSTLRSYFHAHVKYTEVYNNFDFPSVVKTMDQNFIGFLPYRDEDGSVLLVMKAGKWDPSAVSMAEIMRTLTAGLILSTRDPATQVAGFKVIVDFKGFGLRHVPHVSPTYLFLLAEALQNCFPGRFRAVHIVNEGSLFSYIWAVLKNCLTKKLKERFFFHGKNAENLCQHISPEALPEEYGGNLGPFDNKEWVKLMKLGEVYITSIFDYGYHKNKGHPSNLQQKREN